MKLKIDEDTLTIILITIMPGYCCQTSFLILRILTGKTQPEIELKRLQKV